MADTVEGVVRREADGMLHIVRTWDGTDFGTDYVVKSREIIGMDVVSVVEVTTKTTLCVLTEPTAFPVKEA
jgi:hypothetical protein